MAGGMAALVHELHLVFRVKSFASHALREMSGAFRGAQRHSDAFAQSITAAEERLRAFEKASTALRKAERATQRELDRTTASLRSHQEAQTRATRAIQDTQLALQRLDQERKKFAQARGARLVRFEERESAARERLLDNQLARVELRRAEQARQEQSRQARAGIMASRREEARQIRAQRAELDRQTQDLARRHDAERRSAVNSARERVMELAREARMMGLIGEGDFSFNQGALGQQIRESGRLQYDRRRIDQLNEMRRQALADYKAERDRIKQAIPLKASMTEEERAAALRQRNQALGLARAAYNEALAPIKSEIAEMKAERKLLARADAADRALVAAPTKVDAKYEKERQKIADRRAKLDEQDLKSREDARKRYETQVKSDQAHAEKVSERRRGLDEDDIKARKELNKVQSDRALQEKADQLRSASLNSRQAILERVQAEAVGKHGDATVKIAEANEKQARLQDRAEKLKRARHKTTIGQSMAAKQLRDAQDRAAQRMERAGRIMTGGMLAGMTTVGARGVYGWLKHHAEYASEVEQGKRQLRFMGNVGDRADELLAMVEAQGGRLKTFTQDGTLVRADRFRISREESYHILKDLAAAQFSPEVIKELYNPMGAFLRVMGESGEDVEREGESARLLMERLGVHKSADAVAMLSAIRQANVSSAGRVNAAYIEMATRQAGQYLMQVHAPLAQTIYDIEGGRTTFHTAGAVNTVLANWYRAILDPKGGTNKTAAALNKRLGLFELIQGVGPFEAATRVTKRIDEDVLKRFGPNVANLRKVWGKLNEKQRMEALLKTAAGGEWIKSLDEEVKRGQVSADAALEAQLDIFKRVAMAPDPLLAFRNIYIGTAFPGKRASEWQLAVSNAGSRRTQEHARESARHTANLAQQVNKPVNPLKASEDNKRAAFKDLSETFGRRATPYVIWTNNQLAKGADYLNSLLKSSAGDPILSTLLGGTAVGTALAGGLSARLILGGLFGGLFGPKAPKPPMPPKPPGSGLKGAWKGLTQFGGAAWKGLTQFGGWAWEGLANLGKSLGALAKMLGPKALELGKTLGSHIVKGLSGLGARLLPVLMGALRFLGPAGLIAGAAAIGASIGQAIQKGLESSNWADRFQNWLARTLLGASEDPRVVAARQRLAAGLAVPVMPSSVPTRAVPLRAAPASRGGVPVSHLRPSASPASGAARGSVRVDVRVVNADGSPAKARATARVVVQGSGAQPYRTTVGRNLW